MGNSGCPIWLISVYSNGTWWYWVMGGFTNKMDWSSRKGKTVIVLMSLGVLIPVIGKVVSPRSSAKPSVYSSLEKAEAACIGWQQSGDVHESLSQDNAWQTYGRFMGQGSCDFVTPSLGRRYSKQMNGKELVLSRICVNDKANNTIVGRRNDVMEHGGWIDGKNEGTYKMVTTFRYWMKDHLLTVACETPCSKEICFHVIPSLRRRRILKSGDSVTWLSNMNG